MTRAKLMDVLKDWAERELGAKPRGYDGNSLVEMPRNGRQFDLGRLADRILDLAAKDAK